MIDIIKTKLYFPIAWYFRFFAAIRLRRWKPRIVVVTGSSGKTTLLHLLESQLGKHARFSHHANSSYGIPFDILDLHRKSLRTSEWLSLFLKAPVNAFKKSPEEKIYVVEADTDRWGEGKFLAEFLRPEVVLWVSVGSTHAMNFEGKMQTVEEAIAYDFGYFLEYCSKFAVIDGDSELMLQQVERTKVQVKSITKKKDLQAYTVQKDKTAFTIHDMTYSFQSLLPEEVFYSLAMAKEAVAYLGLPFDASFGHFMLPPGRGTILQGVKQTALIDSTYNANLSSMHAMLSMFAKFPAKKKWVVLSDMLELGEKEQEEHEKLAEILAGMDLEMVILVGKRVGRYTYPSLRGRMTKQSHKDGIAASPTAPLNDEGVVRFEKQKDVLEYLQKNLQGGEVILFKGSQSMFLEGIIEPLLENKKDAGMLPRRGEFWENKRKQVGL